MNNLNKKHRDVIEESFSEASIRLLKWQKSGFEELDDDKNTEGREHVKSLFMPQKNSENGPDRMVRVLDFLSSRMELNDGGQLRKMLIEMKNGDTVSALLTSKKGEPVEILKQVLKGEHDSTLDASEMAGRNQVYAIALYLYMHTSGDSEEDMMDTLEQLIMGYDDPNTSRYDYGIDGLSAAPILAKLCRTAIEKHDLGGEMRSRFEKVFEKGGSKDDTIPKRNIRLTLPEDSRQST